MVLLTQDRTCDITHSFSRPLLMTVVLRESSPTSSWENVTRTTTDHTNFLCAGWWYCRSFSFTLTFGNRGRMLFNEVYTTNWFPVFPSSSSNPQNKPGKTVVRAEVTWCCSHRRVILVDSTGSGCTGDTTGSFGGLVRAPATPTATHIFIRLKLVLINCFVPMPMMNIVLKELLLKAEGNAISKIWVLVGIALIELS